VPSGAEVKNGGAIFPLLHTSSCNRDNLTIFTFYRNETKQNNDNRNRYIRLELCGKGKRSFLELLLGTNFL
jgi:hypothetical protein